MSVRPRAAEENCGGVDVSAAWRIERAAYWMCFLLTSVVREYATSFTLPFDDRVGQRSCCVDCPSALTARRLRIPLRLNLLSLHFLYDLRSRTPRLRALIYSLRSGGSFRAKRGHSQLHMYYQRHAIPDNRYNLEKQSAEPNPKSQTFPSTLGLNGLSHLPVRIPRRSMRSSDFLTPTHLMTSPHPA